MLPIQDKVVFVSRLNKDVSDVDKEQYTAHSGFLGPAGEVSSAAKMNIQPANAERTVLVDGVFGKTYDGYTSYSGILETMRVTVSGTNENYIVRGREPYENGILPSTYELVLTKDKR